MANQTASFTPETNRRFLDQFFFDLHEVLFHCTLKEAARFRVPMAFGEETAIKELRRHASGRFLSAARAGGITSRAPSRWTRPSAACGLTCHSDRFPQRTRIGRCAGV
jgi:hypothetical protein